MGSQADALLRLIDAPDRYDLPFSEVREVQLAATNERLGERLSQINLLRHQAESAGVFEVGTLEDLVPLLFAHTTYKSYPESWLVSGKWDRMARWLETVSTYPVASVNIADVADVDDWLARLEAAGTYVSCSSGTTGKCSMIAASTIDRMVAKRNTALAFSWCTGIAPDRSFKIMGTVPIPSSPRNNDVRAAMSDAFSRGDDYTFPGAAITIGQISRMVALRRQIAGGTAAPDDIAGYEALSSEREVGIESGMHKTIEALIDHRGEKLLVSGQLGLLFQMTEQLRSMGFAGKDFHADNAMFLGGGPKGAKLPPDWREVLMDTYNVPIKRVFQYYGMQEINTTMPRCDAGRYHVPPWLIVILLDPPGEKLVETSSGEAEGRAGFFDLSLDGRWGGVISGDKVSVRYRKCDCGHEGPTIGYDIVRYADLGDGDKITCAGTIDAYVRGVS